MSTNRRSSAEMARLASEVMQNGRYSDAARSLAASVLSQSANEQRQTSAEMASLASTVLNDSSYSQTARDLAASVLSQRAPQ
uniref:hypothetical protein n=1 Tax=Trichocoleus desertorum TaxID=1481672 RepID=UPI0025B422EB|nr:hypothetical protein [Trichocoleus desertorum]